ncbi:MAG: ribonuclease E/G [Syntrophales bacterium]|jgi:ribonuclease E|nr:ribonuclease E/G [Syntrophales bacterium]
MSKQMLINTIDEEESRMAILEDGQLTEYSIKMAMREPVMGNIYKGVVRNIQRGLRAAFVDYGVGKSGFLPLRDVSDLYCESDGTLKIGKELFVQVVREGKGEKGAMLTTYLSLPGRYLVLMPNKESRGISRKIESEADRKKLKQFMDEISDRENMGFIVRTAGINRTKQELTRDFQMLVRLWRDIEKKAERMPAPALVYKESEFAVRVFRDFFTSDIDEILIDNIETLKKMKAYCKAVSPRNVKSIKQYRGETPIFDTYNVEEQINAIYRERVELKSGGSLVIEPTEAVITIDVNSGRLNRRDAEETAFRTNLEAAEEIAKQLRLRDLGGLIVVDFIDMMERKHNAEVERTFKNALKNDRSRIQLAKISKFGILELSRQKKESTIQEISYTICSRCKGSGWVPSIEYLALSTYRKIKSEVVRRDASEIEITLPSEVASYLLNHKRREISQLEQSYNVSVVIFGSTDMFWPDSLFKVVI